MSKGTNVDMKIVSWKLVAYDEDDKEFNVDVHSNDVAYLIEDFLSEQFGEINDDLITGEGA